MIYEAKANRMGSGGQPVSETLTQRKFIWYFGWHAAGRVSGIGTNRSCNPGAGRYTRDRTSVAVVLEDIY